MTTISINSKAKTIAIIAIAAFHLSSVPSVHAEEFAVEQITAAIGEIKAGLGKGDPGSVRNSCSSFSAMAKHVADAAAAKALIDEGTKLCNFDVPLSQAEMEVKKAEKARAADPKRKVLSECFSADWGMAISELKKGFAEDPKVKDLEARWM